MKIAMLYVCTGKYEIFWDTFYNSCEMNFYKGIDKEYFVFSDNSRIQELKNNNVHVFYQAKSGWPYDTLLRFNWFCTIQDKLRKFDYCYYANANTQFIKPTDVNIFPLPNKKNPLILGIHSHMYYDYTGVHFHPERNPKSTAFISEGTECRAHCGGFWGGTSEAIITMCCELRDRIAQDLNNGIVATWHDQSHLTRYALEVDHYNIEKDVVSSEEYIVNDKCVIVFLNKDHFGGNNKLRQLKLNERINNFPKKVYKRLLATMSVVHLDGLLRKIVKLVIK